MYLPGSQRQPQHSGDDSHQRVPPKPKDMLQALHKAGIEADPGLFDNLEQLPGFYMSRYQDKPEYDEGFFQIK